MKEYWLTPVKDEVDFEKRRSGFPLAKIDVFPWGSSTDAPESYAVLAYDQGGIYIFMRSDETVIRAEQRVQNGPIYTDSCLEFYLMPDRLDGRYFNFECNPLGVMYISVGRERAGRTLISSEGPEYFKMKALRFPEKCDVEYWSVSYYVPFVFIEKYVPSFNHDTRNMRGNFYKCGNLLPKPHWGCWNRVEALKPDFHRPEYFGQISSACAALSFHEKGD
jgi:hypothetical protein